MSVIEERVVEERLKPMASVGPEKATAAVTETRRVTNTPRRSKYVTTKILRNRHRHSRTQLAFKAWLHNNPVEREFDMLTDVAKAKAGSPSALLAQRCEDVARHSAKIAKRRRPPKQKVDESKAKKEGGKGR